MATCAYTETCIFFNELMADMPSSVDIYKKLYCKENFQVCARYKVREALGVDAVPMNLFPHQKDRIDNILSINRKTVIH